jgi:hypothetical protein
MQIVFLMILQNKPISLLLTLLYQQQTHKISRVFLALIVVIMVVGIGNIVFVVIVIIIVMVLVGVFFVGDIR